MGYRENVVNAIKTDLNHPFHKGVKMQAHHLISKNAVFLSGLKADLEHLGYDINVKENLTLFPCTLKGACHLKVQLHRGNHTALSEPDLNDDDQDSDLIHPATYHAAVVGLLQTIRIERNRGDLCRDSESQIQKDMDELSIAILGMIEAYILKLTKIANSFMPMKRSGCCNETSVGAAKTKLESAKSGAAADPVCDDSRDHRGQEGITLRAPAVYNLRVGK